MRKSLLLIALLFCFLPFAVGQDAPFAFVAIGDTGCGCDGQEGLARRLIQWHAEKPFNTVVMTGDVVYGKSFGWPRGGDDRLFYDRFDRHYNPLRQKGVEFYVALGNHDLEANGGRDIVRDKDRFNIPGPWPRAYYSFNPGPEVSGVPLITFFALDSTDLDRTRHDAQAKEQLTWLGKSLAENKAIWKVVFLHHPLYTPPGKHTSEVFYRESLEKIITTGGVNLVLAGHNHFYARMKPQNGIYHFVTGGGGRSLKTPRTTDITAAVAKQYHFVYFEVYEDRMLFWTVPASGDPIDQGTIEILSPLQKVDAAK